MSLPHALLTALIEKPATGIELAARFDRSIGYYWHATHQQIYRELGRMEQAGWVRPVQADPGSAGKRAYEVLTDGRDELRRWAGEAQDPAPLRYELLIRLRAEAVIGDTGVAADIERRLSMHRAKLAIYRGIEAREFGGADPSRAERIQHVILKAGILSETLWIDWSEQALNALR